MKRLFLLLILVSTVIACKKDKTGPGNCKITTIVYKHSNGTYSTYYLEYDNEGRVTKFTNGDQKNYYDYAGNGQYMLTTDFGGVLTTKTLFELNEAGLLKSRIPLTAAGVPTGTNYRKFEYNSKGELQKEVYKNDVDPEKTIISTWLDGNTVQTNRQGALSNYTYYTDKAVQDGDGLAYIQLLQIGRSDSPRKNKNLVKSIAYPNLTYTYTYEFDKGGKITKMYEIYNTNTPPGDTAIYFYEYSCK